MKSSASRFATRMVLLIAVVWTAAPAPADDASERIKAIERELEQLKTEQLELKKEATAAAAAMPSFSYQKKVVKGSFFCLDDGAERAANRTL